MSVPVCLWPSDAILGGLIAFRRVSCHRPRGQPEVLSPLQVVGVCCKSGGFSSPGAVGGAGQESIGPMAGRLGKMPRV